MRPRQEDKEIGPPTFRNKSNSILDLIRSRIDCSPKKSNLEETTVFKHGEPTKRPLESDQRYNAIQALKKYTKFLKREDQLSRTFHKFDAITSKKSTVEHLSPQQMVTEAKR